MNTLAMLRSSPRHLVLGSYRHFALKRMLKALDASAAA
jgi:hypothetical protein